MESRDRFAVCCSALVLGILALAASVQAGVVIHSVQGPSGLAGHSLYTLTAVSDNPNEPILGFDFGGDPYNNDPATGFGFFGPMSQVNPIAPIVPTVFQDNNAIFPLVDPPRQVNEDSQFLFNSTSIFVVADASQEGPDILQAIFAFEEPRGLSVPFVQLVIPDASAGTVGYRGDVLIGQIGAGVLKHVQGSIITSHNLPPSIQPILRNIALGVNHDELANLQFLAMDEFLPADELVWSDLVVEGPGTNPNFPAATDPQLNGDGIFNWNPNGWRGGQYKFTASVADERNITTEVALTVNLTVPEPISALLLVMALGALVATAQRPARNIYRR